LIDITNPTPPAVARLLDEALAAAGAGRHAVSEDLLARAACEERAIELTKAPCRYWADARELFIESADGTGPCPVFQIQTGEADMQKLAELLNCLATLDLSPRDDLTDRSRFVVDGEYVARYEPPTVFCGFDLAIQVAHILNSGLGEDVLCR
jgi:hypothetical protein